MGHMATGRAMQYEMTKLPPRTRLLRQNALLPIIAIDLQYNRQYAS